MTEAEWLAANDPALMLQAIAQPEQKRKWRLAINAICRTAWPLLDDQRLRDAIEIAEKAADDWEYVRDRSVDRAYNAACAAANAIQETDRMRGEAAGAVVSTMYAATGAYNYGHILDVFRHIGMAHGQIISGAVQSQIIRDLFGNPFRPVTFSSVWRTSTAVGIAQQMYDARDFGAMPILADALQDAGCEDDQVLAHCRGAGPHVRGCWVVDGVLSKG